MGQCEPVSFCLDCWKVKGPRGCGRAWEAKLPIAPPCTSAVASRYGGEHGHWGGPRAHGQVQWAASEVTTEEIWVY